MASKNLPQKSLPRKFFIKIYHYVLHRFVIIHTNSSFFFMNLAKKKSLKMNVEAEKRKKVRKQAESKKLIAEPSGKSYL